MSTDSWPRIDRLKGAENYHTWAFAMRGLFELDGLEKCVSANGTETDDRKNKKAKGRLIIAIDPSLYVHIENCENALEIWVTLQSLFESSGSSRRISLLRQLFQTRLEECESMSDYVTKVMSLTNRVRATGYDMNDEALGAALLVGLPEKYEPLIMALEGSGSKITGEMVKLKLLDPKYEKTTGGAFFGRSGDKAKFNNGNKRKVKCFSCGKRGHMANECKSRADKSEKPKDSVKDCEKKKKPVTAFSAMFLTNDTRKSDWYIDSGASQHMTPHSAQLTHTKPASVSEIVAANNNRLSVTAMGRMSIQINGETVSVNEVLCVPKLSANLLSVAQLVRNGNKVVFDKDGCSIYNSDGNVIVKVMPKGGVYKLSTDSSCMLASYNSNCAMVWHRRLGHLNYDDMRRMRDGAVDGISFDDGAEVVRRCTTCMIGKHSRTSFKQSSTRAVAPLDLIHSDLCGPMENVSIGGARYLLTLIDDNTRKVFVYFLAQKSEVLSSFKEFKAFVEVQLERKIKAIRTDNGTEYCNKAFDQFCRSSGILHQKSVVYTPQQNGVAERMNRTLVERARCMLADASLNKSYWAEAINMAAFLANRSINSATNGKIPEELWSSKRVDLKDLRIFGTPVMVFVPKEKRKKWDAKSARMLFVGYSEGTKGYRCVDPDSKKVVCSRDVKILETDSNQKEEPNLDSVRDFAVNDGDSDSEPNTNTENTVCDQDTTAEVAKVIEVDDSFLSIDTTIEDENDPMYEPDETVTPPGEHQQLRRTERLARPRIQDGHANYASIASIFDCDPTTVAGALDSDHAEKWTSAMKDEIQSLTENSTWDLVQLPSSRKAIKSKWVFKTKYDADGNIVRHKARLVAKGCSQKFGVDYNETYSPVVRYTSLRFLIALAAKRNMKIDQMDAVTAYLQGDLEEEIYMDQPEGYNDGSGRFCRLNKAIYGLRQSGREWNKKLDSALMSFGLTKSRSDPCVYFSGNFLLIIAIYVDDILFFWEDESEKDKLKRSLSSVFKMKDIGVATYCVGLHITYVNGGICLDQTKYVHDVLARFNMTDCKAVATPSDVSQKLSIEMSPANEEERRQMADVPYQEAVGSLLYLVQGTRPDIAFAVSDVSRFNSNPGKAHWVAVKRVLRYLKATSDYKLFYTSDSSGTLTGYTDADWASDIDKRRSCTGYVYKMCGAAISWASKRQPTVALSSTEAEYMALSSSIQEAIWLRMFGRDLDPDLKRRPIEIQCDNQSALTLAANDCFRARSKHIDVRHHYIRDKILDKSVTLSYTPTEEMAADILTKAVNGPKVKFCAHAMGLTLKI